MATKYEVVVGLNYSDKRAEPGDIISDLPDEAIPHLVAISAIRPVEPEKKSKRG